MRSYERGILVPLAGIEPALLAELDFESSASTSSATGAFGRGPKGPVRRSGRNIAGGLRGSTRADVIVACLDTSAAAGYDAGACLSMNCAPENARDISRRPFPARA